MKTQVQSPCIESTDGKEEYGPPILGCLNSDKDISLTSDMGDTTIMSEMMREGSLALARSREKIEHKRQQESKYCFGEGLQKGFLSSIGSKTPKNYTHTVTKREALVDSTFTEQAKFLVVESSPRLNKQKPSVKNDALVFPEVQKVMNDLTNTKSDGKWWNAICVIT